MKHLQPPSFPCVGTSSCVSLSRRARQQASSSETVISLPTGPVASGGSATIWMDSVRMQGQWLEEKHTFFFHLQNNFLQVLFGENGKKTRMGCQAKSATFHDLSRIGRECPSSWAFTTPHWSVKAHPRTIHFQHEAKRSCYKFTPGQVSNIIPQEDNNIWVY